MDDNLHRLKKNDYILIFSILTLLTYITLFVSRSLDDNRLTNWQWAFIGVDASKIFFILIPGIVLAYIFSRVSIIERHPVICLFFFSYIISALFWREPEVIVDASRYFTQAKHLEFYGVGYFLQEWGKDINAWTDLPLMPFLYGLIFKFFAESRPYIQIFTTFLFSMTVVLTYLIGKTLWDEDVGFFGGILLLGMPYLFTQVPLMLVDVPTMFFLSFSIFAFIKAMDRGGWFIGLSSIVIFLTFFSKYSTWLMLSVLVVIFLIYLKIHPSPKGMGEFNAHPFDGGGQGRGWHRKILYRCLLVTSIAVFLIGVVFLYKFDVFSEQIRLLLSYQKPGLKRWSESFISTFFFQIHPFITAAALYSVYAAFKKKDLKYLIICWLVFLVVLLQIKRIRYIIMVFPMISLMASYGLMQAKNKEIVKFISLCIVISALIIAVFVYLPFMQKISMVNLKAGGEFLNSIEGSDVEVFTLLPVTPVANPAVSVPILDLFTKKRVHYNPPSFTFTKKGMGGLTDEEIQKLPLRFTWEYKNPGYYSAINDGNKKDLTVVVISDKLGEKLPYYIEQKIKGFSRIKWFNVSENIFSYSTFVTVYYR